MYTLPRCTAPQGPRARALGGGGQGPEPRRGRRAERRRRGRRADRRRDGGRAGGALPRCVLAEDYPQACRRTRRASILVEAGPELFSMFKPNLRAYAARRSEKRTVEVMTGERVSSVITDARHAPVGHRARKRTRSCGARACPGQPARRSRWGSSSSEATASASARSSTLPRPPRGLRRRGHRCDHRRQDGAGAPPARVGCPAVGRARRRSDLPPPRGQGDQAVQVQGQGDDGAIGRGAAVVQMLGGQTMKGRRAQLAWGPCTSRSCRRTRTARRRWSTGQAPALTHTARRPDHRGSRRGLGERRWQMQSP